MGKQRRYAITSAAPDGESRERPFDANPVELPGEPGPWELLSTQFVLADTEQRFFPVPKREQDGIRPASTRETSHWYFVVWTWGSVED